MMAGQVVLTRECLDCTSGGSSGGDALSGDIGTTTSGPFIQRPAPIVEEPAPPAPLPNAQPSAVAVPGSPGAVNVGVVPIKTPPGSAPLAPSMPKWLPWALAALVVLAALGSHE